MALPATPTKRYLSCDLKTIINPSRPGFFEPYGQTINNKLTLDNVNNGCLTFTPE